MKETSRIRDWFLSLFFNNFQDFHGAGLYADAASDALAGGAFLGLHHNLHGANLYALTAGGAKLLVDHVHTGLGVLGDSTGLTNLCALATLDTDHRLSSAILLHNLDAGQVLVELLIECLGAGSDALQASHTFYIFFYNELLHRKELSFINIFPTIILYPFPNSNHLF